ncbi:MAG: (2Fe-2S)-binding protein [Polyangiaceae bacterium]|nr:(2Fe-2S)-binding protein [Polyangiaceae bacterium]
MPIVTFESVNGTTKKTVDAPKGGSLANICDDHDAPIPFSCRSAVCGTCHIEVLEGQASLLPPGDEELDVLEAINAAPPRFRLACCAQIKPGPGAVRVRAQNE